MSYDAILNLVDPLVKGNGSNSNSEFRASADGGNGRLIGSRTSSQTPTLSLLSCRRIGGGDSVELSSAGLCRDCQHGREVRSDRGSVFLLCERSRSDPHYRRYPRLPVLTCAGYEKKEETPQTSNSKDLNQ